MKRSVSPGDSGQALPLMVLVLMVLVVSILALGRIGDALDDSARAQTAADAAALAGALEGDDAAARLAADNGGELTWLHRQGTTVDVEVKVGGARAQARATARVDWKARPEG